MAYHIFVSYSSKNLNYVKQVTRAFVGLDDIKLFVSQYSLEPGNPLTDDLLAKIEACDLFLLIWSQQAKTSEWVSQEIGVAKAKNKAIMPVVTQSGLSLPGFIKDLKYLDLTDKTIDKLNWLRKHVFNMSQRKKKQANMTLLGIGAALLLALASGSKD